MKFIRVLKLSYSLNYQQCDQILFFFLLLVSHWLQREKIIHWAIVLKSVYHAYVLRSNWNIGKTKLLLIKIVLAKQLKRMNQLTVVNVGKFNGTIPNPLYWIGFCMSRIMIIKYFCKLIGHPIQSDSNK